jgi:phosphatidylinositol dimannoside acyltransferase
MPEREPFSSDVPGYLKYYFFRAACALVGFFPVRATHGLGVGIAEIAYRLSKRKRETVYENMRRVRPEGDPHEWHRLARHSFYNYARYWVDFLRCYHLSGEEIVEFLVVPHGTEWFDISLEKGRGIVLALPHYGSWDMIGGWVGHRYPSFWAVAEVLKPLPMYEFHTELRRRMGIRIIPLAENTVEKVIEVLLSNGMVCLLSDRLIAGSGVEVEFFGEKVLMPIGPALLGVKLGTAVIPCLTIKKYGRYHGYVGPPLEIEVTGDTRRDVQVNTQKMARVFEDFIREDPTQWHMFQPIFKANKGVVEDG